MCFPILPTDHARWTILTETLALASRAFILPASIREFWVHDQRVVHPNDHFTVIQKFFDVADGRELVAIDNDSRSGEFRRGGLVVH